MNANVAETGQIQYRTWSGNRRTGVIPRKHYDDIANRDQKVFGYREFVSYLLSVKENDLEGQSLTSFWTLAAFLYFQTQEKSNHANNDVYQLEFATGLARTLPILLAKQSA